MKKSTVITLVLLAFLATAYWLSKKEEVSAGIKKLTFPKLNTEEIDSLEIIGQHNLKLVKENSKWFLVSNSKNFIADQNKISSILDSLALVSSSYYVTQDKNRFDEFGFNQENQNIIKLSSKGKEKWSIILGKSIKPASYYAKATNDDLIYVIKGSFNDILVSDNNNLRDKNFIKLTLDTLQKISLIKNKNTIFTLIKNKENDFELLDKANFRLDKNLTKRYIDAILNLRAFSFIDEQIVLAEPNFEIELDGKKISFYENNKNYIVKKDNDEQLYKILQYSFDDLNKELDGFRDLLVMNFEPNIIAKIIINNSDKIIFENKDNKWIINKNFDFEESRVTYLLSNLSKINAARIANDKDKINISLAKNIIELIDKNNNHIIMKAYSLTGGDYAVLGNIDTTVYIVEKDKLAFFNKGLSWFKKENFELPALNENTKGFKDLPIDVQRQLLEHSKKKNRQ